MTRRKLFADISFSTAQTIFNQVASFVLFFLVSRQLDKTGFGTLNWMLAVTMTGFTVLGLGYDQLAVKKTATGAATRELFNHYFFHTLIAACFFMVIAGVIVFARHDDNATVFLSLALSQALLFLALPAKQIAAGLQRFGVLCWMSVTANMVKLIGIAWLAYAGQLNLNTVAWVFVAGSIVEFLISVLLFRFGLQQTITLGYNRFRHASLIRESLPQFGITVTNVLVLRADWILLGLLATAATVADYSFAYRCFEFSVLPLAIIGPVLLPRIARQFKSRVEDADEQGPLIGLLRLEILIAVLIAVVANAGWTQSVDLITAGKYGHSTRYVFMILSLCTPLLYLNNIFWSINFARGRMKLIFRCILITFLVNLFADLLLMPFFSSFGAAIGFVIAMIVQTAVYARSTELKTQGIWKYLVMLLLMGAAAVMGSALTGQELAGLVVAPVLFLLLVFFSGNWPLTAWHHFRKTGLA